MREPNDDVARDLKSQLDAFERANPNFIQELDLLGVKIDEYELALAGSNPKVVTGSSSVSMHDLE